MKDPLITVVVPIYNVENQLRKCINSIIGQSYQNLEIILIDDGSKDNCPAICDEFARIDSRIKVIHKQNEGLGMARNTGIEQATGQYICFFDSDDYIESKTIEECCCIAQTEGADLVCFGHIEETSEGKVLSERIPRPEKNVFRGEEIKTRLMPMTLAHDSETGEDWNLSLSAWCGMFSMDVITKSAWRFVSEREIISEDIYSVLEYYSYTDCVAFINKPFYHYVSNPLSLSKSYRQDRFEKLKTLAIELHKLTEKMGLDNVLQKRVYTIFLGLTIGALKQIIVAPLPNKRKYKDLSLLINDEFLNDTLKKSNHSGESIFKRLLFFAMCNKMTWLCFIILKIKCCIDS